MNFLRSWVLDNINPSFNVSFLHPNELFCTPFFGEHSFRVSFCHVISLLSYFNWFWHLRWKLLYLAWPSKISTFKTPTFAVLSEVTLSNEPFLLALPIFLLTLCFLPCLPYCSHHTFIGNIFYFQYEIWGVQHWERCGACGTLRGPVPTGIQIKKKKIRIIFLLRQTRVCSSCLQSSLSSNTSLQFCLFWESASSQGLGSDPALHLTTRSSSSWFSLNCYEAWCLSFCT